MKQPLILWISAVILSFLTGYIQNASGQYYPVTGTIGVEGKKVSYKFDKIFSDKDRYKFIIRSDNPDVQCILKWRDEKSDGWNSVEMSSEDKAFFCYIPRQSAGKKIQYFAEIYSGEKKHIIPGKPVVMLFRGYVPSVISSLHFIILFAGLLLSYRTGLSALGGINENKKIKKLTLFTVSLFFVYTIALTPFKKSFEQNAIGNKVIPVTSLFDLQSILLLLIWIAAMIFIFRFKDPRKPAILVSVLTVLVFLFIRN